MFHSPVTPRQSPQPAPCAESVSQAAYGVLGLLPALIYAATGALLLAASLKLLHASTLAFAVAAGWSYWAFLGRASAFGGTAGSHLRKFVLAGLAIYGALTLCIIATSGNGWPDYVSFALSVSLGALASVCVNQLISLGSHVGIRTMASPAKRGPSKA